MTTSISRTYADIGHHHGEQAPGIVQDLREIAAFLAATLGHWQSRSRQRRRLMSLDDRMLRDIGISRAEAAEEFSKPFWKA